MSWCFCVLWVQLRWQVNVCFVDIGWNDDHHCLNFLFITSEKTMCPMPYWTTPTSTISLARFLSFCLLVFFWKFWHWRIHNIIVYYRYICFFLYCNTVWNRPEKRPQDLLFYLLTKIDQIIFFYIYHCILYFRQHTYIVWTPKPFIPFIIAPCTIIW
jgi:hypothetical protein